MLGSPHFDTAERRYVASPCECPDTEHKGHHGGGCGGLRKLFPVVLNGRGEGRAALLWVCWMCGLDLVSGGICRWAVADNNEDQPKGE